VGKRKVSGKGSRSLGSQENWGNCYFVRVVEDEGIEGYRHAGIVGMGRGLRLLLERKPPEERGDCLHEDEGVEPCERSRIGCQVHERPPNNSKAPYKGVGLWWCPSAPGRVHPRQPHWAGTQQNATRRQNKNYIFWKEAGTIRMVW